MRTSLQQKTTIRGVLSPQQIQLMKLLQVPTASIDQRIKEELEANPALDEGDDMSMTEDNFEGESAENEQQEDGSDEPYELDDYLTDYIEDDPNTYKTRGDSYNPDQEDKEVPIAVEYSFHEYLEEQIGLLDLKDERQETIAIQIIGSIDEDGYLRRDILSIADDLMFSRNIIAEESEIEAILQRVRALDPPGVGASDLRECLLIQLNHKLDATPEHAISTIFSLRLARRIIDKYFDSFSKKHFDRLKRQLNIDDDDLRSAIDEILKLNPKPASGHISGRNSRATQYVVPDFMIQARDGDLVLTVNNRNAPELHINSQFQDMLQSYDKVKSRKKLSQQEKDTVKFIKQKIDSARWFIEAIQQRQDTMYRTMYAIMQFQYDFFLSGDQKKLHPMILQDIADITSLDVSTEQDD